MIPPCPAPDNHPRHSPEYVTHSLLTRWFDERCVTVRSLHLPDDKALELGEVTANAVEHDVCRELLVRLARRMKERSPKPVRIAREGLSERQTAEVRRLARRLADLGIVARAFQADGTAVAVVPLRLCPGNATGFAELVELLDGRWLEYYALGVARQVWPQPVALAQRLELSLPGGHPAEIDVFALVGGRPVAIECKSGRNYRGELAKCGTLSRILGVDPARSILAVRSIAPRDARSIGLIHGLTVTPASDLASVLVEATAPQGW